MRKMIYGDGETAEKEIDGVTFICLPPIGEVETKLSDMHSSLPEVDASNKTAVQKRNREYRDGLIDTVLIGWKGEGMPEFPNNVKPSTQIIPSIKTSLMSWYQSLMYLDEEDTKNS